MSKLFKSEVQEDEETKELYIELPSELLSQMGWDIGDDLIWEELEHGGYSITKKEKPSSEFPVDDEITKGTRMDDNYYYFRNKEEDV